MLFAYWRGAPLDSLHLCPVWSDVRIKSCPILHKHCRQSRHKSFFLWNGYFCYKIWHQSLSKIVQLDSFTLATAVCIFRSRLHQCRDRKFPISTVHCGICASVNETLGRLIHPTRLLILMPKIFPFSGLPTIESEGFNATISKWNFKMSSKVNTRT